MALGEGGLDAQVEQRMDAYRGNPQQLQKRYGQSKELLDLLALQKLTSEKKQVAADMQLKAEQNPNTIAQQREQEALALVKGEMGGTLGELTGRTASTLGQKQKTSQQNMQRIAKSAGKPPSGIAGLPGLSGGQPARPPANPQAQGLAGARMAQAAAQGGPVRMAQGGIIGFAGDDGNNQVKSPTGRLIEPFVRPFTKEGIATQKLRQRVAQKFGAYGGYGKGLFTRQTPEAYKYATSVLNNLQSLDNAALLELEAVNFDPMVTDLSALPVLPTDDGSPPPADDETPEIETETDDDLDITNIGNVGREPTDFFANVDTEYTPSTVPEADKSQLEAATTAMTAGAEKKPTRQTIADLENADLKFVDAPYDATGKEMLGELTTQFRTDAKGNPISSLDAARKSSDIYEGRADKAATYDQQEKDLRALQGETLDPDRLAKLSRMRTLAGGRFGPGGIGREYVASQLAEDKRRNEGLEGIRSIQDTGINVDQVASGRGQVSGENAATRTENRRTAGLSGMRGLLADQETRALQGQAETNKINIANFNYKTAISENDFKAAAGAIRDQNASLRKVVEINSADVNNQVKINLQNSEEENKAKKARIEQQLAKAIAQQDAEHANNELLMTSETELTKLLEEREKSVREVVALAMVDDPLAREINAKLAKLANKGETGPQVEELVDELNELKQQFTMALIETVDGFGNNFARMTALKRRIAQLQEANSMLGGTLSDNDDDISMDELPGPR